MAKRNTINWQKAADDAAKWVSQVLSEAHRDVIQWHGPSGTFLAFDTQCPDEHPEGYLKVVSRHLEGYGYEVRAVALSEDKDSLAVLFTFGTDIQDGDEVDTARNVLWETWHAETDLIIDAMPKREQKEAKKEYDLFEGFQRQVAAARIERYLMERPSQWDRELEQAYNS
jgi:hypothetical protein